MEDISHLKKKCNEVMQHALAHLEKELLYIRAGKANPSMLGSVKVDYFGAPTPLSQVATVNATDARTLSVQPWEKSMIQPIEKAILEANLGLNPMNNGLSIIINIPVLTEERRKELIKQIKVKAEEAKVSIRNSRHEINKEIKKSETSDDIKATTESEVLDTTNTFVSKVDEMIKEKEKEIMTV